MNKGRNTLAKELMRISAPSCFIALAIASALGAAFPGGAQAQACKAPAPVQHALEKPLHVPNCSPLAPTHYPPTSGAHYGDWAKPGTYSLFISPGYYIHNLEHGGVALLYNCPLPKRCPGDVAALQAVADAFPADPLCARVGGVKHRILIAGDSVMDSRFAAVSWGWSLKTDCMDTAAFRAFLEAHYAHGPEAENFCADGTDFSGTGWCVAPLGLQPRKPTRAPPADPAGRKILWEGSLAARAQLAVEVISLDGTLLGTYPLGQAGPGPARAAWDAAGFRRSHPSAGAVACRVRVSADAATEPGTASKSPDSRALAEVMVYP